MTDTSDLFNLLKELTPLDESTDTLLVFDGVTSSNSSGLKKSLTSLGFKFDNVRSIRGSKLFVQLTAPNWDKKCPIYLNWESLFKKVSDTLCIPDVFLVASDLSLADVDSSINTQRLEILCGTHRILSKLCDHCEPPEGVAKGSERLLFLIESEQEAPSRRYDFKPETTWDTLVGLTQLDESIRSISKLEETLAIDDKQADERKSVMRSSFGEFINKCESSSAIFNYMLHSLVEFQKKYDEHHEMFIQRFSVNKVLSEISKQDLEYTSKINDIVSSGQARALAIPASLAVIGAIMKIEAAVDAAAVAMGLFITTLMIVKSLNVHAKTFSHIKKRIKAEFQRYDSLAEQAEVRKQALKIQKELTLLVSEASENLIFVRRIVIFTLIAGLAYIAYSANESLNKPTETEAKAEGSMVNVHTSGDFKIIHFIHPPIISELNTSPPLPISNGIDNTK
ncbi:hypothetical protein [Shewanella japonica]|uniref:Transmembrane protein n=1 Tax=Shewanella japonica TaxID=93973 RepID=A0ABM6JPZ7_9GAMM|nr:hypothetical protein [Shewanella japonica]ARD24153.1 hypothetical protein SJ2017_3924 [Shewanella japonica]